MRVVVIGSGGREHALVWRLLRDRCEVFCLPGSAAIAGSLAVDGDDDDSIVAKVLELAIDLVVIGPEAPLQRGLADRLRAHGLAVVGPDRNGAQLEASKAFAKQFMDKHGVATARYRQARGHNQALALLSEFCDGVVVKFDGLAAGKGVIVCADQQQAKQAVAQLCANYGQDAELVLEERLRGREVSVLALADGKRALLLPTAQDHKRLRDNDCGPNTGGMGAICPVPWCTPARLAAIDAAIVQPTLRGLQAEGIDYRGVLYFGIMETATGPKLLEYNARFGDPETQAVLPQVGGDFSQLLLATARGDLTGQQVQMLPGFSVAVVVAAHGYPQSARKNDLISGLNDVETPVFHAGTRHNGTDWYSRGGRLLAVLGQGQSLQAAQQQAYTAVTKIHIADGQLRTDIGKGSLAKRAAVLFSGRGSNLAALLQATRDGPLQGLLDIVLTVSNQPQAGGIAVAQQFGVAVAVLPSKGLDRQLHDRQLLTLLAEADIDCVLLAGYMRVLTPTFVKTFAGRIVNIHPADTQLHQGLHGYQWAWEQRLQKTKITVHLVDEGLDTGTILAQAEVDLSGAQSLDQVEARGLNAEHALYARTVAGWLLERD